ncbi:hypothetical protein WG66_002038 [Moniliophthora roreri]|uniref:Uncharacterized protein n=1 Tax=Moniliophthora roreri TaxID=221103 RepID=A0A0W0F8C4_MONRR|nr:hypothetical protein WG66_002038 [Moniliophthora roreri]
MGNSQSAEPEAKALDYLTEDDVIAVRIALLKFLPRELVDIVLDDAEYWPRTFAKRYLVVIANTSGPKSQADWCYLVTPQIIPDVLENDGEELRRPPKIHSVTFTTKSRDQGWGGPPKDEMERYGPYHGSFSWFEAVIIRPSDEYPNAPWWLEETSEFPVNLLNPGPTEQDLADADVVLVGPPRKRWFVCCNLTANDTYTEHTVTWSIHDEDPEHIVEDSMRGHVGMGKQFLSLLQPGDRIALMARAMFPGWENDIHSASIEVVYSM